MKLQQYINSFVEPLAAEAFDPLCRLLDVRNKMARGLASTIGPDIYVSGFLKDDLGTDAHEHLEGTRTGLIGRAGSAIATPRSFIT